MPIPDLSTDEIHFAEALEQSPEFRQPHGHSHGPSMLGAAPDRHARSKAGGKLLDVYQAENLVIFRDTDGEWFTKLVEKGLDINWALDSFYEAFYDHYGDDYEYITVLLVRDFGVFAAFYQPMANDVKGIGYNHSVGVDIFDQTETKVEGMIFMNYYGLWTQDEDDEAWQDDEAVGRYVFGQEFMHRWGSFVQVSLPDQDPDVLLGRDTAHWSYWLDTTNSPMEGNHWVDSGEGTWTTDHTSSTYSPLDLYLMGFAPPEEVGPQTLLLVEEDEQRSVGRDASYTPLYLEDLQSRHDMDEITVSATPVSFTIDDIVAVEGPRDPAYGEAATTFHMAVCVLLMSDDEMDDALVAKLDGLRASWEAGWEEDVLGRADLITTLGDNDAPAWGSDEGGDDSGVVDDSGTTDSGGSDGDGDPEDTGATAGGDDDGDKADEPSGCGCDGTGALPGVVGALGALGALTRRKRG